MIAQKDHLVFEVSVLLSIVLSLFWHCPKIAKQTDWICFVQKNASSANLTAVR